MSNNLTHKELSTRIKRILELGTGALAQRDSILAKIEEIRSLGITSATAHWPKDKPGCLELIHPTNSEWSLTNGKRREYIGKDPDKQKEALETIERWHEHNKLIGELAGLDQIINSLDRTMTRLDRILQGEIHESYYW